MNRPRRRAGSNREDDLASGMSSLEMADRPGRVRQPIVAVDDGPERAFNQIREEEQVGLVGVLVPRGFV